PRGEVTAFIGAGVLPRTAPPQIVDDGSAVTVPGAVQAWLSLLDRFGSRSAPDVLRAAIRLAEDGIRVDERLAAAVSAQRDRLVRGGAGGWSLVTDGRTGATVRQPELGSLLRSVSEDGAAAFYGEPIAAAIEEAVRQDGGTLDAADLAGHR